MTTLNEWAAKCHKCSTDHGFWDNNGMFKRLIADADLILSDRNDLDKELEGLMVSQRLALIHSEVGEALEAHRMGNFGLEAKSTFEDELADILIRVFDLAGHMAIDLDKQVEWKYNHNLGRPHKHGKAY